MSSNLHSTRSAHDSLVLEAGCKVNLYLNICGRRPDGLHELESVFLPLAKPRDRMLIESSFPGTGLQLTCSRKELEDDSNILYKTYQLFAEWTGLKPDLSLYLEKNIPFGAGLGGGSSDAAVLLSHLNSLLPGKRHMKSEGLQKLAWHIGSDVPFFLFNQPALIRGAGEKIRPLTLNPPDLKLLLICPDCRVSTAQAYQAWDRMQQERSGKGQGQKDLTVLSNRFTKSFRFSGLFCWNDFEQVVFAEFPKLRTLKETLLKQGAAAVVLTGSGAALIALYHSQRPLKQTCCWLTENQMPHFVNENWGVAKR